jgi:hypothetical protein
MLSKVSQINGFGVDEIGIQGACQERWQHSVPRRAGVSAGRINLTFRVALSPEELSRGKRKRG